MEKGFAEDGSNGICARDGDAANGRVDAAVSSIGMDSQSSIDLLSLILDSLVALQDPPGSLKRRHTPL